MNYTKHITNTFLKLAVIFAIVFSFGASYAYAVTPLEVAFETDPLFSEEKVIPGDGVTKTVTVTNNSEASQSVIVEAINATDDDGLGDVLDLVISSPADGEIYSDTLGDFLRAGEVPLSTLLDAGTTVYSFAVSFQDGADNSTQKGTLGFDLCVGFEGGTTYCGDTVTGGEGDDGDGGSVDEGGGGGDTGGGGSGNGGSGSPGTGGGGGHNIILVITDEDVVNPNPNDGTAIIEWDTNYLSTSQVVYGLESDPTFPFSIDLTDFPYFGYPLGTVEDFHKVTSHSVKLTGLELGKTYRFRVVSRASPPTVGYEYTLEFTEEGKSYLSYANNVGGIEGRFEGSDGSSGTSGDTENIVKIVKKVIAGGIEGGGAGIPGPEDITEEEIDEAIEEIIDGDTSPNAAAAFFGFPESFSDWLKYIILFIIIIVIIYIILSRRRKQK